MKRYFGILFGLAMAGLLFAFLFTGCDYARMKDQESVRTYEDQPPDMPKGTIPVNGGFTVLKASRPENLHNPLPSAPDVLEKGRIGYGYFCIMCHGANLDGNGTVGQSFSPLPADLKSPYVGQQSDGELFYKISFGFKRQPPLADTVSEGDLWAIIRYVRSVKEKGEPKPTSRLR